MDMADPTMEQNVILPFHFVMQQISADSGQLTQKWNDLYVYRDEIKKLRLRCTDFLVENDLWSQALKSYTEKSWKTDGEPSEILYDILIRFYKEMCVAHSPESIIISGDVDALENKYNGKHADLITDLLGCLDAERKLLLPGVGEDDMDTTEKDGILFIVEQLDTLVKRLDEQIKNYDDSMEKTDDLNQQRNDLFSDERRPVPNGLTLNDYNGQIQNVEDLLNVCKNQKSDIEKEISLILDHIIEHANIVLGELQQEMDGWRMEQRKYYVDVAAQPCFPIKPPLTEWSAHAGRILFDLIQRSLPNITGDSSQDLKDKVEAINSVFDQMMQCSFVVTDQVKNVIKVSMGTKKKGDGQDYEDEDCGGSKKFSCPKFKATVRLLAAASIDSVNQVRAYFVHEDSLSQVQDPATHDFSNSKYPLKDTKQKGPSCTTTVDKNTGVATFKALELKSFNREKESNVAKEKFRLVFQTKITVGQRLINLWAMSLPIVVITGASQHCNACGSLLWQCLNPEDKGQFPPPPCPEELPWSAVKELLDTKIRHLGGRGLTQDEEKHLVCRITGGQRTSIDTDPMIQFKRFCIDKMMDLKDPNKKADDRKKSATFWMWFQAVYNLINTHLKEYWKKELILGFLDKSQANDCLKECQPHTFLLRFSNNIITDAQGQNMCGAVSVSYKSADKPEHMEPSTADDLKKYNLAQMLQRMINGETHDCEMKWVYPEMKSREEVYKEFLDGTERKHTDGYTILKEMLVVDNLGKMSFTNGRPIKRPVYGKYNNKDNSKVAKVTAVSQSVPSSDEGSSSGPQPGNLPNIVSDREPSSQPVSMMTQVNPVATATSSRTMSVPPLSHVPANQNPSKRSNLKTNSNTTNCQLLKKQLSEPVRDGLKFKLMQSPNATLCSQGSVQVNQQMSLSKAEDMLDMAHQQQKLITGGNNGFEAVRSTVKPCSSPDSTLTLPVSSIKQSGSPLMDPKIEHQSPSHSTEYNNPLSTLSNPIPTTAVPNITASTGFASNSMMAENQQLPGNLINQQLLTNQMVSNNQQLPSNLLNQQLPCNLLNQQLPSNLTSQQLPSNAMIVENQQLPSNSMIAENRQLPSNIMNQQVLSNQIVANNQQLLSNSMVIDNQQLPGNLGNQLLPSNSMVAENQQLPSSTIIASINQQLQASPMLSGNQQSMTMVTDPPNMLMQELIQEHHLSSDGTQGDLDLDFDRYLEANFDINDPVWSKLLLQAQNLDGSLQNAT
ncbi:uncharacterized protein [Argopecten irradians]|uniref:uncharacterized protein isoform X2 n=1 Tax=Argopecten irradians TaxID=31199 RepID=UPI003716C6B7